MIPNKYMIICSSLMFPVIEKEREERNEQINMEVSGYCRGTIGIDGDVLAQQFMFRGPCRTSTRRDHLDQHASTW